MEQICPFCGESFDSNDAEPGGLSGTVHCPKCNGLLDLPLSSETYQEQQASSFDEQEQQTVNQDASFSQTTSNSEQQAQFTTPPPPLPEFQEQTIDYETPAWEGDQGFLVGFWQTILQVLFHPVRFFSSPPHPKMAWPLSFGIIVGTLGSCAQMFWDSAFGEARVVYFQIILMPLFILIGLFFYAGITHLMLMILGGARKGFIATFRVVAYGSATSIFMLLPYMGSIVGAIWGLVVSIAGLAAAHQTGRLRVFFALILPLSILFILIVIIALAFGLGAFFGLGAASKSIPGLSF